VLLKGKKEKKKRKKKKKRKRGKEPTKNSKRQKRPIERENRTVISSERVWRVHVREKERPNERRKESDYGNDDNLSDPDDNDDSRWRNNGKYNVFERGREKERERGGGRDISL